MFTNVSRSLQNAREWVSSEKSKTLPLIAGIMIFTGIVAMAVTPVFYVAKVKLIVGLSGGSIALVGGIFAQLLHYSKAF